MTRSTKGGGNTRETIWNSQLKFHETGFRRNLWGFSRDISVELYGDMINIHDCLMISWIHLRPGKWMFCTEANRDTPNLGVVFNVRFWYSTSQRRHIPTSIGPAAVAEPNRQSQWRINRQTECVGHTYQGDKGSAVAAKAMSMDIPQPVDKQSFHQRGAASRAGQKLLTHWHHPCIIRKGKMQVVPCLAKTR